MKVVVFQKHGNTTLNQVSISRYDYELENEDVGSVFTANKIEGIKNSFDSLLIVN
jgi:hypothetical protein